MTIADPGPTQQRQLAALRQEYPAAGLALQPADRSTTERIISRWYARIGRKAPRFLWFDGRLSCSLACDLVEQHDPSQLGSSLYERLASETFELRGRLQCQVAGQLGEWSQPFRITALGAETDRAVMARIERISMSGRFWRQIDGELGMEHWAEFCRQFDSSTGIQFSTASIQWIRSRAGFWAGTGINLAALYAGHECLGVNFDSELRELFRDWDTLQRACAWWFPFEHGVVCSERLQQLHTDMAQRLHNERGAAIACRDGLKVHAWHGVVVPAEWIDSREQLDPWIALKWPNLEQRRAAAEIIGWAKVLELVRTRVVDAHPDPQIGTLLECALPPGRRSRFLRVRCGTGREFVLSVPTQMTTALEANAWTYGMTDTEYQLEARS